MTQELATLNQGFDRQKIDLIKQTVAKGATDLELQLFFHACQRTGLDPLMKQIYAIKRWSGADRREVMSIQTGIDGYRLIADRTGQYGGSDEPVYEVDGDKLMKATVTVVKLVRDLPCRFTASARWDEYVQLNKEGQPTSMWKKMPYLMLAKCAEALALRKAFPAELSGVYTHEEMMQAETETKLLEQAVPAEAAPSSVATRQEHGAGQKATAHDLEPPSGAPTAAPAPKHTDPQMQMIADWKASMDEGTSKADLEAKWDQCVRDPHLSGKSRAEVYKYKEQRVKEVGA